jgi:predicted AAA+ superfamily ATPase
LFLMLQRKWSEQIEKYLGFFPVVGIIGPRQVGKTTLVKEIQKDISKETLYLDLELPSDFSKMREPEMFLEEHQDKLVIIDEVQRLPGLFPLIRALVGKNNVPGRFILLGSASPELIRDSSESLAGRIIYQEIKPFDIIETGNLYDIKSLWLRGGFPKAFLAPDDVTSFDWLGGFVRTYLERDLPLLGLNVLPSQTERLWQMLSQINAQLLNYSLLSKSLELSAPTVRRYIDFFEAAFLVTRLQPYYKNISKRLIKTPKIYFNDTGILHYFLSLNSSSQLHNSIYSGNSWETFCINQIRASIPNDTNLFFYRTQDGAECDLVFEKGGKVVCAAEIKYSNSPNVSKGNYIAWNDIKAEKNYVITPASDDYPIDKNIRICNISAFINNYLV